jgi:hypothetical protein
MASIGKKPGSHDALTGHEWWTLRNYAEHKQQVAESGVKDMDNFDLLKTELFGFTFDQNGITIIDQRDKSEDEGKIFILVADVHS